ncbi:MAG: hypothetical protein KBT03_04970 [Bacteroidales bacterium]|nr:hypothetical protein [Candidatus Scybalousia scybalohippi]
MEGVQRYNGLVCVEANWMIKKNIITPRTYINMTYRKTMLVARRGCKNTPALISWMSIPLKYREEVVKHLGCSIEDALDKEDGLLLGEVKRRVADCQGLPIYDWVESYKIDGKHIETEKRNLIYNNILISDAIVYLFDECARQSTACGHRMKKANFWQNMCNQIGLEVVDYYPNTLPQSTRKLYQKIQDYREVGYEVFISKMYGNKNAQKMDEKQRAFVEKIIGSGNKFDDRQIAELYKVATSDTLSARRVQQIRKEIELTATATREGAKAFYNTKSMQVSRTRPDMPLKFVSLDGWDVEFYYQDEKSYYNRLTIVVVLDAMNDYPLGYAIGERETNQLNIDAVRNAVHHTKELFGNYYQMWQVQSDNYGRKELPKYYNAVSEYYTPAKVGNAKAKPVERYWQYLKKEYFSYFPMYTHSNITSKDQPNMEWLQQNRKNFPSKEEAIRIVEAIIALDRQKKVEQYCKAWAEGNGEMKKLMDMSKYLMAFGERGNGNMLTANGLRLVRGGKEYKYECFDIQMREHADKKWILHYDMDDMQQVVAESEDGKLRYMMQMKDVVPMALVDYTEEDYEKLSRTREYNKRLDQYVTEKVVERDKLAAPLMSKAQLEGDFSAKLLTDKNGQHKDNRYLDREKKKLELVKVNAEEDDDILNQL